MLKFLPVAVVALTIAALSGSALPRSTHYHQHSHASPLYTEHIETTGAFDAVVETCHDGDSCLVLAAGQRIHVRLHGIDTPEIDQPFGPEARAMVLRLVLGHRVTVHPAGQSYKRLVASFTVADGPDTGADVSAYLVNTGYAWVEPRYNRDPTAPARQAEAQRQRLGLWKDPDPIPPWVWRHTHSNQQHNYQQR